MRSILAGLLLLIAVLMSSACGMLGGNSNSANGTGPTNGGPGVSGGEAFKPSGDAKADLVKMSAFFMKQTAFQAVMDGTGSMPMHMEVQYNAPDRYHIKTGPGESVVIGSDMYSKRGDTWTKLPGMGASISIDKLRETFTEEGLKRLSDAQALGDESVDGKPAYKYHFKIGAPSGGVPYETDLWVIKDTGLPAKIHVTYSSGVLKEMTTIYTFDPNVKVEAPIQ